ncbi:hypothetical protein EWT52_07890 [Escherichia coli O25b:H4]|nr:hypothetical protein EWT52_07890 [Escherichia coli O25b:H4]
MNHEKSVDFIGVGTGPFNLSIAAVVTSDRRTGLSLL